MKELEYDEFEVVLERSGDGYSARVVDSPTGPASAMPFVPPVEAAELPTLRATMRGSSHTAVADEGDISAAVAPAAAGPKAFGTALFEALFNEKALNILRTSQFVAAKHGRGLRLRIRFSDVAELANLPWELLYDPGKHKFLCQYRASPTVRLLDLPEPVTPLKVHGPLRMLVVISGPKDLPELDAEKEWMQVQEELAPLVDAGRIEIVRLPVPTLEALHAKVLAQEFHVFHFVGHGGINANGEGHLAFVWPNGLQHQVRGSHLGVMLSNSPVRLAVLNSCQGGTVSADDPYGSSAIALVEQGIPAVIAMQFPISDGAARTFSRTLYDSVAAGRSVDLGVTLGRQAVLATSETEWATPVLYLRGNDGVLFELADGPVDTILEDPHEELPPQAAAEPVSEPVPEPVPERVPEPDTDPEPSPTDLAGSVSDGSVDPPWPEEAAPGVPVTDGEAVVPAPVVVDPEAPGGVVEVKVRHVRTVPVAILLVLALALVGWLTIRPWGTAVAAPTNVSATISPDLVSMSWDPSPADGPAIDHWEIYLGDRLVTTAPKPTISFPPSGPGRDYRVVAIAADGQRSDAAGATVTVPPTTTTTTSPTTTSATSTTSKATATTRTTSHGPQPAPTTADLEILWLRSTPVEGDAEMLTFQTDNYGRAEVDGERVHLEVLGGGQVHDAFFRRGSAGDRQWCEVRTTEATCEIGSHGIKGAVFVEVTVRWDGTSTGLKATVQDVGGTKDVGKMPNTAIYEHVPTPTITLTQPVPTITESPTIPFSW